MYTSRNTTRGIGMKEIKLTQGQVAIVDDEDFEMLNQHKWYPYTDSTNWYAIRNGDFHKSTVSMHREIMRTPSGMHTDHLNGNGLDNRKENLRICTHRENCQNRHKKTTSPYPGVSWIRVRNKWVSHIQVNGRKHIIGAYNRELDAAKAYRKACADIENGVPVKKQKAVWTSKYKGVSWAKERNRWRVCVTTNGRQRRIGYFKNEEDAARAYKAATNES
jgi:hypothetical protein